VTAGVAAYGPDQSLLRLRDELAQLNPDLVVFTVFSGNDFGDLVRNRLFELSETGVLVPLSPRFSDGIQRSFTRASTGPLLLRAVRKISSARNLSARAASQTRSRDRSIQLMERWLADCRREYAAAIDGREPVVSSLFYDHYDADLALEPRSPSARYKVDLMEAVLASAHDETTRAGVPFLLVVVPEPLDLISDYDSGVVDRAEHPEYRPDNLTRALSQIAERRRIPALDLFPEFIDSDPATLYFRFGNNHWNDAGQALAAELVGARVLVEAWLKPAH
jgi:lysophospholipase L1-like esterase